MNKLLLKKLRKEINCEINRTLKRFCGIPSARRMLGYQMGLLKGQASEAQGKRFRPILCLLSSLAISGDYKKALPAAAAIELIHNFSLIHDDIQDRDKYRRGRITVWKKWGSNQAINAGDAMHTLASLAFLRLFKTNPDLKVVDSVSSVINSACFQMCEGQMLDVDFEKRRNVTLREYLKMIQKKTAALIECSPVAGVLVGGGSRKIIGHYRNFGFNAGMAFQIFNDLSGLEDLDSRFTHFKSDIARNKKSLPVILAMQGIKTKHKKLTTKETFDAMKKSGAISRCRKIGEGYLSRAILELDKTGIRNTAQELLKEYVSGLKAIN